MTKAKRTPEQREIRHLAALKRRRDFLLSKATTWPLTDFGAAELAALNWVLREFDPAITYPAGVR